MRALPRQAALLLPAVLVIAVLALTAHTVWQRQSTLATAETQSSFRPRIHLLGMPEALENDLALCAQLCESPLPYNGTLNSAFGVSKAWPPDMRHLVRVESLRV